MRSLRSALVSTLLLAGLPAGAATSPVAQDAFFQQHEVVQGLDALRGLSASPQALEAACWAAVGPQLTEAQARIDACLSAAVQHVRPGGLFRRYSPAVPLAGAMAGIGVTLDQREGRVAVIDLVPGAPAEGAGVQRGDVLQAVDGVPTQGQTLDAVSARVRGAAGSTVRLTLVGPSGAVREVAVSRARFTVAPVHAMPVGRSWYVQLRSFSQDLSRNEVTRHFDQLLMAAHERKQLGESWVLDLRGNAGGPLRHTLQFADRLMPLPSQPSAIHVLHGHRHEPSVATDTGDTNWNADERERLNAARRALLQRPMLVLIDGGTGGGAAWLADALRMHAGAVLVGERTDPRAQVRRGLQPFEGAMFELPDGGLMGEGSLPLDGHGVEPDVVWPGQPERVWIGRPPTALEAWLANEWPLQAQAVAARRDALRPRAWTGASPRAGTAAVCLGPIVLQAPKAERFKASRGSLSMKIRLDGRQVEVDSEPLDLRLADAVDTVDSDEALLKQLQSEHGRRLAQLRQARPAGPAVVEEIARIESWVRSDGVRRLPLPGAWIKVQGGVVTLRWAHGGWRHDMRLGGFDEGVSLPAQVFAHERLSARLAMHDEGAPASTGPGLCLPGGGWLAINGIRQLRWSGEVLSDSPDRRVALRLFGSYQADAGEAANEPALIEDGGTFDRWLFSGNRHWSGPPERLSLSGQTGLGLRTDHTDRSVPQASKVRGLGVVTRMPSRSRGPQWRFGLGVTVFDADDAMARAREATWAPTFDEAAVLPLARP